MQVVGKSHALFRVSSSTTFLSSTRFLPAVEPPPSSEVVQKCRHFSACSRQKIATSGIVEGCCAHGRNFRERCSLCCMMLVNSYSAQATTLEIRPTGVAKDSYDKMAESIKARTCPPNALMWSLIENCQTRDDIKMLFSILPKLRIFIFYAAKKGLLKHNPYGLSPGLPSAHQILLHAKEHNDTELMVDIMKLIKRNELPLQPGTADLVFSICYKSNDWDLLLKYLKRFLKAGVKLRQTTFDTWMEFAAKRGDIISLWEAEKLRSESMRTHTLASGFASVKGFLLEHKPEDSATIVQHLNQVLSSPSTCDHISLNNRCHIKGL